MARLRGVTAPRMSKSPEIDSMPAVDRFDWRAAAVPGRAAPVSVLTWLMEAFDPGNMGPSSSPGRSSASARRFLAEEAAAASGCPCHELLSCLYIRRGWERNRPLRIRCSRSRFDASRTRWQPPSRLLRCPHRSLQPGGTNPKRQAKTTACRKCAITNACYLCNTRRKRGEAKPLEAVP